jgi:hypothetical protein
VEVDGETVIAVTNPTKIFETIEYSLDSFMVFVEVRGEAVFPDARDFGRNVGRLIYTESFDRMSVGPLISMLGIQREQQIMPKLRCKALLCQAPYPPSCNAFAI